MRLLQGGAGDGGIQRGQVGQCLVDGVQAGAGFAGLLDGLARSFAAGVDGFDRCIRLALQVLDHGMDLCRRLRGALGQQANLVGDHGKATALFPGPRRFDGRIQRQQVGLLGDGADDIEHTADARAVAGQVANHLHGLVDGQRQPVDLRQAAMNRLLAMGYLLLRGAHFPGGLFGSLGHVLHGISHLVHGGGYLVHL